MNYQSTEQALATITDAGLFERIAAAILREYCPLCRNLSHPGINASGKTVRAPLDGICFVPNAEPPHLIAVHHTTTASDGLQNKWLHDPALVKPRKGTTPKAPPGDIIKTAEIVAEERKRTPNLQATLILTTNEEPNQELHRDVVALARNRGLEVQIWSRSRLCHSLDNAPTGQWIRAKLLGIKQELLSPELLHDLSLQSLSLNPPPESPKAWVNRALDEALREALQRDITFLTAESGLGKSVACHRLVTAHVEKGGFGLFLSHSTIASATSLEQAVMSELQRIYPLLSSSGPSAFEFCSPNNPILLIVEDINKSGQDAPGLAEKIANWSRVSNKNGEERLSASPWRLICPVWPQSLNGIREQARNRISQLCVMAKAFSEDEGTSAVLVRGNIAGHQLSRLQAQEIASALGYDPLLIALYDHSKKLESNSIIADYIEGSLKRAAADDHAHTSADYGQALRMLAVEMLLNRKIDLNWLEVASWFNTSGEYRFLLSRTAHKGELLHLVGPSSQQRLIFRHDRVRDWLLADGIIELQQTGHLSDGLIAEPYFAEFFGAALLRSSSWEIMLERVARSNPLALFYAFYLVPQSGDARQQPILEAINKWLNSPDMPKRANDHLRWEALAILARTDSVEVPPLVHMFPNRTDNIQLARLRNGDFLGGVELCYKVEPGMAAPWRDVQIEHAMVRYGDKLNEAVAKMLKQPTLENSIRVGALRLAGILASDTLAEAIEVCWERDPERVNNLAEYLWAFAKCCGDDPARYLGPV